MAKIHFSSGESYEFDAPVSVYDAASALGIISREVITAKVNGALCELSTKIDSDADVTLLTFKDAEGKQVFRHTAAHVMAQAVKRLYPETKQTSVLLQKTDISRTSTPPSPSLLIFSRTLRLR
jgi:threonyl-tRNA synthetase